jgi:hypothetical protein
VDTGGQELGVVVTVWNVSESRFPTSAGAGGEKGSLRSLLGSLSATALEGNPVTLALEALGSNQTLDLGGLGVVGLALTGDGTTDDELADIVLLVETEEAADLGGTLGTESLGDNGVGETGELTLTLLDDAQGKDGEVEVGDGCNDNCQLCISFSGCF